MKIMTVKEAKKFIKEVVTYLTSQGMVLKVYCEEYMEQPMVVHFANKGYKILGAYGEGENFYLEVLTPIVKTNFDIDGSLSFDGKGFEGYTLGQFWNGWDVPYFTREIGMEILEAQKDYCYIARFNEELNQFEIQFENDEYEELQVYEVQTIEGMELYQIGDGWCWERERG